MRNRRWLGLVFISIAVSLIIVDSTIVNVAIPAIVDDLGMPASLDEDDDLLSRAESVLKSARDVVAQQQ